MTIACETLAENFDLRKGWVEVTVPRVDPAKDYTITRTYPFPSLLSGFGLG